MELKRTEIMPGIWLTTAVSDHIPRFSMSLNLLTQLDRETAAEHALIPHVLCCGTALLPDGEALQARLSALGLASVTPVIRKFGEIHSLGVRLIAERPSAVLRDAAELLCSILTSPNTKGGLLNQNWVNARKTELGELDEYGDSLLSYARSCCVSEMCCYEDYSTPVYGESADMESVHYVSLTKEYRRLLQVSPMEIICCLPAADNRLSLYFRDALSILPRGEIDYELGTDIRLNSIEDGMRTVNTVNAEGDLVFSMGYRFGDCIDDADFAGMGVLCRLLEHLLDETEGFSDVSVQPDYHKGIFTVTGRHTQTHPDAIAAAAEDLLRQISEQSADPDALSRAIRSFAGEAAAVLTEPAALDDFLLSQVLNGLDYGPEEFSEAALDTTSQAVARVASTCECDLLYAADFV